MRYHEILNTMEPSAKRARADTPGDTVPTGTPLPQHSTAGLDSMLAAMSNTSHLSLITEAATRHADIMATVKAQYESQLAREAARVISFDRFSKEAWHELNTKYGRIPGSKEYDIAYDVADRIGKMLQRIAHETMAHSSFGTKLSAIETIRKIYKSVLVANGTLGHYVHQNLSGWGDSLISVAETFSDDELDRLYETVIGDNALWLDKFEEVANLAKEHCVQEELMIEDAIAIIKGEEDEDDEDDKEGDGDEHEGEDHDGEEQ